jgi:hypothetical protein
MSPPLSSIEEVVNVPLTKIMKDKIILGVPSGTAVASSTQSKFFINQQPL